MVKHNVDTNRGRANDHRQRVQWSKGVQFRRNGTESDNAVAQRLDGRSGASRRLEVAKSLNGSAVPRVARETKIVTWDRVEHWLVQSFVFSGFFVSLFFIVLFAADLVADVPFERASPLFDYGMIACGFGLLWMSWECYREQLG